MRYLYSILIVIALNGCGGGGGGFDNLPFPPSVESRNPLVLTPKSVTLAGAVNPNGNDSQAWFEWGEHDPSENRTNNFVLGSSSKSIPISIELIELSPETVYYYRVAASNDVNDLVYSDIQTFETPAIVVPGVVTDEPSDIGLSTCTFNGTINTFGVDSDARFEWGLTVDYGATTANEHFTAESSQSRFSHTVSNLLPQTTYHYRAVAENIEESISRAGEDKVCTTLVDPTKIDTDNDGLSDSFELDVNINTDPTNPDTDGDGLMDGDEIGEYQTNPLSTDTDGDGLNDFDEVVTYGTNPKSPDTDGDTLGDPEEINVYETVPTNPDTDDDGVSDGKEINTYNTDPNKPDTDGDTLTDGEEIRVYNTDPKNMDTDGDGLTDGYEVVANPYVTSPLEVDTDGDSIDKNDDGLFDGPGEVNMSDWQEINVYGTNPENSDTDGDGFNDGVEVLDSRLDPLVPDSLDPFPDLIISHVSGPQGVAAGDQAAVNTTIENIKLNNAGAFSVGIYLSTDEVIDKSDAMIGIQSVSALNATLSINSVTPVMIPVALPEGIYYLGAIADFNEDIVEQDELNNTRKSDLTISVATGFDSGDGTDGSATVDGTVDLQTASVGADSDDNGIQPDGFSSLLSDNAGQGAVSITVDDTSGFVDGDEVLIIQVIHDANHGKYEFQKDIVVRDDVTLTLVTPLSGNYVAKGNTTQGTANTVQVVRVPQYNSLVVEASGVLTTSDFDATSRLGGVLAFRADTLNVAGNINADFAGFPGGAANLATTTSLSGMQGWSYTGQGSEGDENANAGGGGGPRGYDFEGGGGGGGYGTAGNSHNGVEGGNEYGDLIKLHPGSGGGSGSRGIYSSTSGQGGSGGGIVYISINTFTLENTAVLSSNGKNGGRGFGIGGGSGGGGSGGSVYLLVSNKTIDGTISVAGAAAGQSSLGGFIGGAGGEGRISMPNASLSDLIVSDVTGPASALMGETIAVQTKVNNVLPASVLAPFKVAIYLSPDQEITTGDIYLGERLLASLAGNDSDTADTSITIPASISPGTYYLGAIADYEAVIDELNEDNNSTIQVDTFGTPQGLDIQ